MVEAMEALAEDTEDMAEATEATDDLVEFWKNTKFDLNLMSPLF